ncbi:hypothetical protein [Amycolatopsis sp. NPDC059657]|uniref:hypothetical protein n=1 Tax=Amycolatopsis sp. NPDC059657 TaxID=3346899 RepID=UPI00366EFB4F
MTRVEAGEAECAQAIGLLLSTQRDKLLLSRPEVLRRTGFSLNLNTLFKVETGDVRMSPFVLAKICVVLGLDYTTVLKHGIEIGLAVARTYDADSVE